MRTRPGPRDAGCWSRAEMVCLLDIILALHADMDQQEQSLSKSTARRRRLVKAFWVDIECIVIGGASDPIDARRLKQRMAEFVKAGIYYDPFERIVRKLEQVLPKLEAEHAEREAWLRRQLDGLDGKPEDRSPKGGTR